MVLFLIEDICLFAILHDLVLYSRTFSQRVLGCFPSSYRLRLYKRKAINQGRAYKVDLMIRIPDQRPLSCLKVLDFPPVCVSITELGYTIST
jgi:hypothetical protein